MAVSDTPPPSPEHDDLPEVLEPISGDCAAPKSRGAARTPARASPKRIRPRTLHLPDDLLERILVQAHRKGKTFSDYVTGILERQVPAYRTSRDADSDAA
jgi:hypothetical protein